MTEVGRDVGRIFSTLLSVLAVQVLRNWTVELRIKSRECLASEMEVKKRGMELLKTWRWDSCMWDGRSMGGWWYICEKTRKSFERSCLHTFV